MGHAGTNCTLTYNRLYLWSSCNILHSALYSQLHIKCLYIPKWDFPDNAIPFKYIYIYVSIIFTLVKGHENVAIENCCCDMHWPVLSQINMDTFIILKPWPLHQPLLHLLSLFKYRHHHYDNYMWMCPQTTCLTNQDSSGQGKGKIITTINFKINSRSLLSIS